MCVVILQNNIQKKMAYGFEIIIYNQNSVKFLTIFYKFEAYD